TAPQAFRTDARPASRDAAIATSVCRTTLAVPARRSAHPHLANACAFQHRIHRFHATDDFGEHRVVVIEADVVDEVDVELGVAGVPAARRQSDGATPVSDEAELVAGERAIAGVLVRRGAAALDHE